MPMEVAPTYDKVVKVWWAYSWRFLGLCFICFTLIAVLLATLYQVVGVNDGTFKTLKTVTVICVGIIGQQWVFHRLLTKGFGKFRLVLIEK